MAKNIWTGEGYLWNSAEKDPYGALNPDQVALSKKLGPYFSSVIDTPAETYSGQLQEPISSSEQGIVDSSNRLSAMSESGLSDLINPDPNVFNNRFNTEVANPTLANWRQNTQPTIEEALPTFSIARGKVVGDALNTVNNDLLTKRNASWNEAQNRRLNAITGGATAMNQYAQTAAIPRIVKQAGLDKTYTEWVRANDAKANSVNQMLNFLGISTGTYIPEGLTGLGQLLAASAGSVASAVA